MTGRPAFVVAGGMVTGVGFDAPSSCAAIRVGITGFVETRFMFDGEWLIGCPVPYEMGWRGRQRLLHMATSAVAECVQAAGLIRNNVPVLLCLPERERPGRIDGLDAGFVRDVESAAGLEPHPDSTWFPYGRIAAVQALDHARVLLTRGATHCIVAGVDTFLVAESLRACAERRVLHTAGNSDGFIPGEAAAAIMVTSAADGTRTALEIEGIGYGWEPAPIDSAEPFRADGLVQAATTALADAGIDFGQVDYRLTDNSGHQFGFKEAALVVSRVLRVRKEEFDILHPADCIGEVGAAIGPAALVTALFAARKNYAPGPRFIAHFANDAGERAAAILSSPVP